MHQAVDGGFLVRESESSQAQGEEDIIFLFYFDINIDTFNTFLQVTFRCQYGM